MDFGVAFERGKPTQKLVLPLLLATLSIYRNRPVFFPSLNQTLIHPHRFSIQPFHIYAKTLK